ncbi:unnamed protein product [Scytosiphon promiscuus]
MSLAASTTYESKTELHRKGKIVVRTHRNVASLGTYSEGGSPASLTSMHDAEGSPASLPGSEAGSRASPAATRGDAEFPMSLTSGQSEPEFPTPAVAARNLPDSPAPHVDTRSRAGTSASLAAVRSLADSMTDEMEAEVLRDGKVVVRRHFGVSRLNPEAETPPTRQRGELQNPSMDVASAPLILGRPEEDVSRDRGTIDAATGPCVPEQMSSPRAQDKNSGGSSEGDTGRAGIQLGRSETLDLRIFCGTWNVAGRKLDSVEEIGLWLDVEKVDADGDTSDPPDLFVIGLQEVVELSAQNVVMDSIVDTQSKANSLQWFAQVFAYLAQYGGRHGVRYVMVTEKQLLGTYILVMAKEVICSKIACVQSALVPTGLGGYFGNKGAVAVRMEVGGSSSLCFVCAHMTSHREHVLARNAEYKIISSKPVFADVVGRLAAADGQNVEKNKDMGIESRQRRTWGILFGGSGQGGRSGGLSPTRDSRMRAVRAAMAPGLPKGVGAMENQRPTAETPGGKLDGMQMDSNRRDDEEGLGLRNSCVRTIVSPGASGGQPNEVDEFALTTRDEVISPGMPKTETVLQADVVFWLGDLNYRIKEEIPDEEVFQMLHKDDLEALRELDQLNIARALGTAFQDFQEGPLCFPPSYKYMPGTKDFDDRPDKKMRCPAWCDRVLYTMGMQNGGSVRRLGLDKYWSPRPLLSDHMPVNALFRTSLASVATSSVVEPEMGVESVRSMSADMDAEPKPKCVARVVLDPPALVLTLDQTPLLSATVEIRNAGGLPGKFHVCKDDLPGWMTLEGDDRGEIQPGEKVDIVVVVDASKAVAAAGKDVEDLCAVLQVEADGGGSGTMLPVVCMVG